MAIGSAFPYSGIEQVPAGKCKVILQASTDDMTGVLPHLSWTVSSSGRKYAPNADSNGRAELLVDAGFNYTVTPDKKGYDGVSPQYFYAESSGVVICPFYIQRERAIKKNTVSEDGYQIITGIKLFQSGARVPNDSTGDFAINAQTADKKYLALTGTAEKAKADENGNNIAGTYATQEALSTAKAEAAKTYATRSALSESERKAGETYATQEALSTAKAEAAKTYATQTALAEAETKVSETYATQTALAEAETKASETYATQSALTQHKTEAGQTYATKDDLKYKMDKIEGVALVGRVKPIISGNNTRDIMISNVEKGDIIYLDMSYTVTSGGAALSGGVKKLVIESDKFTGNNAEINISFLMTSGMRIRINATGGTTNPVGFVSNATYILKTI